MQSTSLWSNVAIVLLWASYLSVHAESQLFQDAVFPYRIICDTEWALTMKTDSVFQLRTTITGKKTQFQLKKYLLDTGDTRESMSWSRVNFAVSHEIAGKQGTVLSSDTGLNKKIGTLRAYELCAKYMQVSGVNDTVWWGELSRWTEYFGNGYCVSVISDTSDLINNLTAYSTLLDSVSIGTDPTTNILRQNSIVIPAISNAVRQRGVMYTLLGSKFVQSSPVGTQLKLQRHRKQPIGFKPGGR